MYILLPFSSPLVELLSSSSTRVLQRSYAEELVELSLPQCSCIEVLVDLVWFHFFRAKDQCPKSFWGPGNKPFLLDPKGY